MRYPDRNLQRATRRSILAGLSASPLLIHAATGQGANPDARAQDERALTAALRSGDLFEIGKARLDLAGLLKTPGFTESHADFERARLLLLQNSTAEMARTAPTVWGMSRMYLAELCLDQRRAQRARDLRVATQAALDAFRIFPRNELLTLRICNLGLTCALQAADLTAAETWRKAGASMLAFTRPPTTDALSEEVLAGMVHDRIAQFCTLSARLAAMRNQAAEAWFWFDQAQAFAVDAGRPPPQPQVLPSARALKAAEDALADVSAVCAVIVSDAGSSLLLTRRVSGRPVTTLFELPGYDAPTFDGEELQMLLWGKLSRETTITGTLGGWNGAYAADDGPGGMSTGGVFKTELDKLTSSFWVYYAGFIAGVLASAGMQREDRVALVMPCDLRKFPIRAARDPDSKAFFGDMFVVSECSELSAPRPRSATRSAAPTVLCGLANPTRDLPGADAEYALGRTLFGASGDVRLQAGLSAGQFLDRVRSSAATHVYLATHGNFGWTRADAGLRLGGDRTLNANDIITWKHTLNVRLFVLSACEASRSSEDVRSSPSSMPNALLAKGVQCVLGALWKVDDISTAILMHATMQRHLQGGLSPPAALSDAQAWIRGATGAQLSDHLIAAAESAVDDVDIDHIDRLIADVMALKEPRPFAHPFYWAAFAAYGS